MVYAPDGRVRVASLSGATRMKRRFDAVITIEDPGFRHGLRFHKKPHPDHLVMIFEDVDQPVANIALPDMRHIEAAVAFGREHRKATILVHCKAGVARSTAIALAIISDSFGAGREDDAVSELVSVRPEAVPNLIVLELADKYLEREGRLVSAWMKLESSDNNYEEHRKLKRSVLERNPGLYGKPLASLEFTASRYMPDSLVRTPGLLPLAEGTLAP